MIPAGLAGPGVGPQVSGLRTSFPPEWLSDYADSVLDPEALRVEVDTFMEVYDRKIAEVGLPQGWLSITCVATGTVLPQASCGSQGGGSVAAYPGSLFPCRVPGHLTRWRPVSR